MATHALQVQVHQNKKVDLYLGLWEKVCPPPLSPYPSHTLTVGFALNVPSLVTLTLVCTRV